MAEKTKAELIQQLTKMVEKKKCIPIKNTSIVEGDTTYQLIDLTTDDGEVGVTIRSWFWGLNELTKKELIAIYKGVR